MNKLVVLELDGDFENQGVRVTLEIQLDGYPLKIKGQLPSNPELANHLRYHWQEKYRELGYQGRIKSKKIINQRSINKRIAECVESANKLRSQFQTWLKSDLFRDIDHRLREELKRDESIRFLICTEDLQLQKLPWQEWDFFERYPLAEIAFSPLESKYTGFAAINPSKSGIRVLAILGDRQGINVNKDFELLKQLPNIELVVLVEPTHQQINQQLWEESWHIIFFAGHSETIEETGRIYINSHDSITIEELWYGLRKAVEKGLQLAIFNSCDGLGLARQLDDLHIPQMIVMRELIPDKIAQSFLQYFLKSFAGGQSLYLAVREARQRLRDDFEREFPCASWLPVICQHPAAIPPTWNQLQGTVEKKTTNSVTKSLLKIVRIALTSTIFSILVMVARSQGVLQSWELKVFDRLMRLRPIENIDSRLLIVEATEADINRYGFPLPDGILAQAIEKIQAHQPRIIGLDVFRDRSIQPGHSQLLRQFQQNNKLIAVCSASEPNNPNKPGIKPPVGLPNSRLGFTDVVIDSDGIVRRHLMFMTLPNTDPCTTNFAFSSQVAIGYLATEKIYPQLTPEESIQIGQTVFKSLPANAGAYQKLDNRGFQILLNYRSYSKVAQRVVLSDLLTDKIPYNLFKNRIILVGVSAPTASDDFSTPYSTISKNYQKMPGVILQAHMISQIISAVLDKRPLLRTASLWEEILWFWTWGIMASTFAFGFPKLPYLALSLTVIIIISSIFSLILLTQGIWLSLLPTVIVIIGAGIMPKQLKHD